MALIMLEMKLFLLAAMAIVLFQLLTGRINMHGLLGDSWNGTFSPVRLQMLTATIFVAFSYLGRMQNWHDVTTLPDIPSEQLLLLGGSHAIYLGGKGASLRTWLLSSRPSA